VFKVILYIIVLYNNNEFNELDCLMITDIRKILPAKIPKRNPVFIDILNPIGLKDASDYISESSLNSSLSKLTSLTTITHAIAKSIPSFTQKHLVVIAQIKNSTYNGKKMQVLFLNFNYDTLFYGNLNRQGFLGVFYDKATQSIGIDVQSEDALAWVNKNLHLYFQVVVNITTHQFLYHENKPAKRDAFTPVCNKMSPVTIWLNQLVDIMKSVDSGIQEVTKLEMHNGDRFVAMPPNFFIVCYLDKILVKAFDKKGWFRYIEIDIKHPSNSNIYVGVKNKEVTKLISKYMDSCNYYKAAPYTVKER